MDIDVSKNLIFLNVGEPPKRWVGIHSKRNWENCRKYRFISAGQGKKWSDQIKKVNKDDIICAYVTEHGFVGIGKCTSEEAQPILKFKTSENNGSEKKFLSELELSETNIFLNSKDPIKCEYLIEVDWFDGLTVDRNSAKGVQGLRLGINQCIYTDLKKNQNKICFLEDRFKVKYRWKP